MKCGPKQPTGQDCDKRLSRDASAAMFIYLSKKIAIPNGVKLKSLNWNGVNGWIVCGGDSGLLKVLKLDSGRSDKGKGATAQSNLSMNQTLEGHNGAVVCVCWNENYRKLTTSDQYGLIIVWMLHKGMWFEEMINNRNKSTVRGMKWTPDGQRICIIYEDGAVIVGSVDGNRLWGKELKSQLSHVQWSPDGRNILFCTPQCEVHIYDAVGNFIAKLPLYCLDDATAQTSLVGIDWYDGVEGLQDANQPTLAIGVENGRLQLMRHEMDEDAVLIDTGMVASGIKWNTNGTVLAVAGNLSTGAADRREVSMVQFYAPHGQHLRTLKVPGSGIAALSWEGSSLRVALAVDSYIYFANIRPDYRWGFFGDTLVCAYAQPERTDATVLFWNTRTDERSVKFVGKLLAIRATKENCVLATQAEDASGQHVLVLCNAIGSPLESKYIDFEPSYLCITAYHVCAASADYLYVWQYRTLMSKLTSVDSGAGSLRRTEGRERCFHVDDSPTVAAEPAAIARGRAPSKDGVAAIAASSTCLLVGRESGELARYSLPHLALERKYALRARPQAMAINCDTTRVSIIDLNGVLSLFDLAAEAGAGCEVSVPAAEAGAAATRFERKDVWDMRWADDNAELLAVMEKTRMYLFRGLTPEEPVLSSAYICAFSDLEIRAVLLDQLMKEPDAPSKEFMLKFETKALRDMREVMGAQSLGEVSTFVEENAHPRLWRLLAEAALQKLDFTIADKAFVRCADYMGIQLVKRMKLLDDPKKQAAEVAGYFGNFDEAEKAYRDLDRRDLALQVRADVGDWFKVVQLVQQGGGDDSLLQQAWNQIGDYFRERQKTAKAAQYYAQAKNMGALVSCYYALEDFGGLERLIGALPEGSPLLQDIGQKFSSVGMSTEAVAAYLKYGDAKAAIDSCVQQHQWASAVELAEAHSYPGIQKVLTQYASRLLSQGKQMHAVELYRKASRYTDAAKLLSTLGAEVGASRMNPLRAKKLFVLAALEVERMRKKMLTMQAPEGGTQNAAQTLASLVNQDTATGGDKWLDSAWKGAEAFHFLLLAQRQLYAGFPVDSMRTALRLREYEGVLQAEEIYSLVALTSFYSKYYGQCSRAFVKLQSLPLPDAKKAELSRLALSIFTLHPPADPAARRTDCPNCAAPVNEWDPHCADCGTHFAACTVSGKSLLEPHLTAVCRACKHRFYEASQRGHVCSLCHAPLQVLR